MRFHVSSSEDHPPSVHSRTGGWHLRSTTVGAISLLFLVALSILLLRRGTSRAEPEPAAEPAPRPAYRPTEDRRLGHYYTVRPDDTLEDLARRFYLNPARWSDIARANDIRNPRRLEIGRQLWIPVPTRP